MPQTNINIHTHTEADHIPIEVSRLPSGSFTIKLDESVTLFFPSWSAVEYFVGDFNNKLNLFQLERRSTNAEDPN